MISSLTFTNLAAESFDFLSAGVRTRRFSPAASVRGESRPRMQLHGVNRRAALIGALTIAHEGILYGTSQSVMEARQDMLATILGDLTAPPTDTKIGALTVKYLGWTETATGDVSLISYDAEINNETLVTLPYRFDWEFFTPYLLGDDSGDPYYL